MLFLFLLCSKATYYFLFPPRLFVITPTSFFILQPYPCPSPLPSYLITYLKTYCCDTNHWLGICCRISRGARRGESGKLPIFCCTLLDLRFYLLLTLLFSCTRVSGEVSLVSVVCYWISLTMCFDFDSFVSE